MTTRKTFFNKVAKTWDKNYRTKELLTFLEDFVPRFGLKPKERTLDVGTGTGILIPFLLKAVGSSGHITAVDFAENMVEICRSKYAHFPNVSISRQEVEALELPAESFDAVVCFGVFPHIENKERALFQMNRVLKTGGKLIIAHALSSQQIKEHHHGASCAVAADELPTAEKMEKMLKRNGFGRIHSVDKPGEYISLSLKLNTPVEAVDL
jgi:ubiquinone/menaquinone biosynthesis C-methylase UbiE